MDLIHAPGQENPNFGTFATDLVKDYTIKQIQDALLGALSANQWKNNLKNNNENNTEQNLDALFSAWGF